MERAARIRDYEIRLRASFTAGARVMTSRVFRKYVAELCEPDPAFDYKNAKSVLKFFGKTAGVMWIDEQDEWGTAHHQAGACDEATDTRPMAARASRKNP